MTMPEPSREFDMFWISSITNTLDFAHFGVREAKLGIQKIGIEFEFSSEAPA
jgi:hypothetical protein